LVPIAYDKDLDLGAGLTLRLAPSGHILGSAFVRIHSKKTSILFSGDIGRPHDILMKAPATIKQADYLVLESTYGNRLHERSEPQLQLSQIINQTVKQKGVVLIPVFAVGRAQELLYYIYLLKAAGSIPKDLPVYLNSPMAVDATAIFNHFSDEHRLSAEQSHALCLVAHMVNGVEESKRLNLMHGPMIILSASGMATGGRVLHHLANHVGHHRNMVILTGYQSPGTRGASLASGAPTIRLHGKDLPVGAEIVQLSSASAHADGNQLLAWLKKMPQAPAQVYVVHGEREASDALRQRIERELKMRAIVPEHASLWPG
jgi:metallo-beta-lactamase family protein